MTSLLVSGLSQLCGKFTPHKSPHDYTDLTSNLLPLKNKSFNPVLTYPYSTVISFTPEYYSNKELTSISITAQHKTISITHMHCSLSLSGCPYTGMKIQENIAMRRV